MSKRAARFVLALLAGGMYSTLTGCSRVSDQPGILFLTVDTLRPDYMSLNGYALPTTPYLDALLAETA